MDTRMRSRFRIEDHIHQDSSGVIFRAIDGENGQHVALRRFFPFGVDGGGFIDDEKNAYNTTVGRLTRLRHPALRTVIGGACDPVDGIPFIVTEWIEGDLLGTMLKLAPLPPEAAVRLITQAIEVCEILSRVLDDEAIWVDTDPQTIILGNPASDRSFTFWVSPLKWLSKNNEPRNMQPLIQLTERVMAWQGQIVSDQTGNGLGAWFNWLRGAPDTNLLEVREKLASAIRKEPSNSSRETAPSATATPLVATPVPAKSAIAQAAVARPVIAHPKVVNPAPAKSSRVALLCGIGTAILLLGIFGWVLSRQQTTTAQETPSKPPPSRISQVNERAEALKDEALQANRERDARLASQTEAIEKRGGVFSINEGELLGLENGEPVSFSGKVEKIEASKSGATLYLYFSPSPADEEPRAAVLLKNAPDIDRAGLETFIGKVIRLTGKVAIERGRPQITISSRADIQPVE